MSELFFTFWNFQRNHRKLFEFIPFEKKIYLWHFWFKYFWIFLIFLLSLCASFFWVLLEHFALWTSKTDWKTKATSSRFYRFVLDLAYFQLSLRPHMNEIFATRLIPYQFREWRKLDREEKNRWNKIYVNSGDSVKMFGKNRPKSWTNFDSHSKTKAFDWADARPRFIDRNFILCWFMFAFYTKHMMMTSNRERKMRDEKLRLILRYYYSYYYTPNKWRKFTSDFFSLMK